MSVRFFCDATVSTYQLNTKIYQQMLDYDQREHRIQARKIYAILKPVSRHHDRNSELFCFMQ